MACGTSMPCSGRGSAVGRLIVTTKAASTPKARPVVPPTIAIPHCGRDGGSALLDSSPGASSDKSGGAASPRAVPSGVDARALRTSASKSMRSGEDNRGGARCSTPTPARYVERGGGGTRARDRRVTTWTNSISPSSSSSSIQALSPSSGRRRVPLSSLVGSSPSSDCALAPLARSEAAMSSPHSGREHRACHRARAWRARARRFSFGRTRGARSSARVASGPTLGERCPAGSASERGHAPARR